MKSIFLSLSYNIKHSEHFDKASTRRDDWSETYLFLESEGNASDRSLLDSVHEVGGVSGDFVSKSLRLDDTHVVDDSLVDVEILGQPEKRDKLGTIRYEARRFEEVGKGPIPSHVINQLTFRSTSR